MPSRTFNLYLAKEDVEDFESLLTDNAVSKLDTVLSESFDLPDFGESGRLIFLYGNARTPDWVRDIQRELEINVNRRTNSACAILFFRSAERIFVATFAHGWMYLNDRTLEKDFGLRASLNALDDQKLKRLERTNLTDALRGSALSPFSRDLDSFGMDDATDLIRTISGRTRDSVSADALTGSYSLRWTSEANLLDLPDLAAEALELFDSDDYQDTAFRIVDLLKPIHDRALDDTLNDLAAASIAAGEANFELGLPANSHTEGIYYQFRGPGLRRRHPDLLLRHYVAAMQERLDEIDTALLKKHQIVACYEDNSLPNQHCSVHTALVGSLVHEEGLYAINEGKWYRLDEAYKQSIDEFFVNVVTPWDEPPWPLAKYYDANGNGRFETEAAYNRRVSDHTGFLLLDSRLIASPSEQRSDFEVCDLLDLEGKRFIHVKKNSRRSNVLSHFFKQGANSAQQMKSYPACWESLRERILEFYDEQAAQRLGEIQQDDRRWRIEFWIADSPRENGEFAIPFFSRISLKSEAINLGAMEYDVSLRFIGLVAD